MKYLLYTIILFTPAVCRADTFLMQDGARLEGEVTGEMDDTLLVKTRYGALTIKKADIQERKAAEAAPLPPAKLEISSAPAAVQPSTAAAVEVSSAQPAAVAEPAPALTFATVYPSTMTRQLVYSENGVAIATETFDAAGGPLTLEGAIKDGTYTEYYPEGGLKTVKTMLGGKANGTLKAYYQSGALQAEAYYLAGGKDGLLRYHTEDGKLLMEASYRSDQLNGWKREYGPDGALSSETYYADDKPAAPPQAQAAPAAKAAADGGPDSQITVKTLELARGERFSFQLNGKYVGKVHLDKAYNVISQGGKIPDGLVKVYTADGRLVKEFVFEKNTLRALRDYEPGGPLKAEYGYEKEKAVKK
ncbi:MAG TPA: hypothetical protein DCW72_00700 [Elusimicrobia bacterium]|nr:MAG: hypothetical protein A2X29_04595 [Elusimicrobia bacterium GWA2_64_40]OGR65824.1 MAG: hypothetical protein A2X30_10200 [Elusimicrobia bacterium GWB2_63_16]HAN05594.1 hypothetical protein [Elusimicrobiota bacterium]HAU88791.1 hypothetical protein [Elusimicrobiota bacterium]